MMNGRGATALVPFACELDACYSVRTVPMPLRGVPVNLGGGASSSSRLALAVRESV